MLRRAKYFQFPLHRDKLCNTTILPSSSERADFQFPLHRDKLCNSGCATCLRLTTIFQFPLHRDKLCNLRAVMETAD